MLNVLRQTYSRVRARLRGAAPPFPHSSYAGRPPRTVFITGMDGAPLRYRVSHQAEQLALAGLSHDVLHANNSQAARYVANGDILYLYRVDATPTVQACIDAARSRRIPVVYDTDDLIWDQRIVEYCNLEQTHSPAEIADFRQSFRRTETLMGQADVFVASTEYLAGLLRDAFGKTVFVNRNAVSQRMVAHANQLLEHRPPRAERGVVIGYFSGWPKAHEPDLAVALPGLLRVLGQEAQARLRIVGHFDIMALPEQVRAQVETVPFQPFDRLLDTIASVDINLAPIVENPHRRAKSAVKMLEAALVGVPTVASDLEPYQLIRHGESGMLADDDASWQRSILALARDAQVRQRIGAAARAQVLRDETTQARAPHFAALLRELAGIDYNQRQF